MDKKITSNILRKENTIKEAMERMNQTGLRVVFITDGAKKLLGLVTDGDIRRGLLSGHNLETRVKEIMNSNPVYAHAGAPTAELLDTMVKKNILVIPVVDSQGILTDIVLLSELKTVPLSSPDISDREVELLNQVLSTPTLSIGPKVEEFERKIADYIGVKFAVAVNSGTSGLHLCVRSLGIKDGDEVITTPFSFIASANCMLFERARPVFVDIDPDTLCIDPEKIEEKITKKTKAILPVHVFGHPCAMEKIITIAQNHDLKVIEDACEAIGAEYENRKVGTFGDCGVLAFYPNKQITTAEGGMILTDNAKVAELCHSMRNQGRSDKGAWLSHVRLGYNYRMSELSAALGIGQVERIDDILRKRQQVADFYNARLKQIKGIRIPYVAPNVAISWFVYVIMLDPGEFSRTDRDFVMEELKMNGIACNNYFPPIHLEPFYIDLFDYKAGDFPITEKISQTTIALPFYNNLSEDQIDQICATLQKILAKIK